MDEYVVEVSHGMLAGSTGSVVVDVPGGRRDQPSHLQGPLERRR